MTDDGLIFNNPRCPQTSETRPPDPGRPKAPHQEPRVSVRLQPVDAFRGQQGRGRDVWKVHTAHTVSYVNVHPTAVPATGPTTDNHDPDLAPPGVLPCPPMYFVWAWGEDEDARTALPRDSDELRTL